MADDDFELWLDRIRDGGGGSGKRFLIIDGVDGHTHYVDVGAGVLDARPGAVLSVERRSAEVREVDPTIAAVAGSSNRRYGVDLHQFHDPSATMAFCRAHVRRLEALRRGGLQVEREPDGSWVIAPHHLEQVEAHERRLRGRMPVTVAMLNAETLRVQDQQKSKPGPMLIPPSPLRLTLSLRSPFGWLHPDYDETRILKSQP